LVTLDSATVKEIMAGQNAPIMQCFDEFKAELPSDRGEGLSAVHRCADYG